MSFYQKFERISNHSIKQVNCMGINAENAFALKKLISISLYGGSHSFLRFISLDIFSVSVPTFNIEFR